MGLALVAKFNLIFTVLPFFLWILLFRFHFIRILLIGSTIILALLIGLFIDYINWGSFTNTYWQFYKHNMGDTGALNVFGTQPWWYYFSTTIVELAPVLSLFFVISIIIFWIKQPKNVITWITLSTVIALSFIGHKEIRYFFPVYLFAPLFISYLFEIFPKMRFIKFYKASIIISNLVFLILILFTPANTKVGVYEFLYNNYNKGETVFYLKNNPYLINNMEPFFYTKFLPEIKELKKENFFEENLLTNSWIVTNSYKDYRKVTHNNNQCKKEYSSYPEKIINLNKNWSRLRLNWYIIYCK
jgi:phosphatidylinositol glycan class B